MRRCIPRGYRPVRYSRFVAVAALASLAAEQAEARPPPNPDPVMSLWFKGLVNPDTSISCCADTDCRVADAQWARDHYKVLIRGEWLQVPSEAVVYKGGNPTGQAVVCWSPALGIMCFVPGPGS
jgi:hypothetical protein